MKRKQVLACAKAAGYHGDSSELVLLYVESRVALKIIQEAYLAGQQIRAKEDDINDARHTRIDAH